MKVVKRNGKLEKFDINKIAKALFKVFNETGNKKDYDECVKMAEYLTTYYKDLDEVDIESIQDDVELYLMKNGYYKEAKAYIKFRDARARERENPWADNDERQNLILSKYLLPRETKKQFIERISMGNSRLAKIFRRREALWGGRNLFAIGREGNITGNNCYVATDPEDTLEDIYRADYEIARTYSYGGGQGLNLSKLRPSGSKVNNSSNTSPGPMVFAEKYSHTTLNTQQENRRGALMLVLNDNHPDIIDFATAKLDINKINGANISVAVSDDFMRAVIKDKEWDLTFETYHEKIIKTVKACDLMKVIAYASHTVGDPGILFIDKVNNYHLLSEYNEVKFTATNPCGEQPLMANGSCNLASINLFAFVRNPFTDNAYFDYERFDEVIKEMIWGLDDLLDLLGDRHPLQKQREHVKLWREVGLGVMGLADLALGFKVAYGSKKFIKLIDKIMNFMANSAARASALKAKKFGVFPKYNYNLISKSEFFQKVYNEETKNLIKKYGLRNSRLLSIAPTGSISNVCGVSGGVEPYFMLGYQRTIKTIGDEEQTIWVYEKTPKKLMDALGIVGDVKQLPDWAKVTSQNIKFKDRALVQATIQKYVDTGISSTFNLPNSATVDDIINIYITAWNYGLKGITVFRNNCAKIGILTGDVEHFDKNPGIPPTITVMEKWYNKHNNELKEYINTIHVKQTGGYVSEKIEHELCPVCGDVLIKQGGCTKCRNKECYYEKCAL